MLDGKYIAITKIKEVHDLVDMMNAGLVEIQSVLPEMSVVDAMNNPMKITIVGITLKDEEEQEDE